MNVTRRPHMARKSPNSKIGQYHEKVKDIPIFPRLCHTFLPSLHYDIQITVPLTCLTRKGTPGHFSDECHSAFEAL